MNQWQRDYVKTLVRTLSEHGILDIGDLCAPPFTPQAPKGPEELFADEGIDRIAEVLATVRINGGLDFAPTE